jgi:hypothetical protein
VRISDASTLQVALFPFHAEVPARQLQALLHGRQQLPGSSPSRRSRQTSPVEVVDESGQPHYACFTLQHVAFSLRKRVLRPAHRSPRPGYALQRRSPALTHQDAAMPSTSPIRVNCTPVLAMWASVVAEQLGHAPDTAFSLASVVAGTAAQVKAPRLGIAEKREKTAREASERPPIEQTVRLMQGQPPGV